jgi:chemotaxis protein methyltransferase CheR
MTNPAFDRLSQRDFNRLSEFIHSYSGIKMPPSKKTMVEGRLRRRLRATGLGSLSEYCRYVFDQGGIEREGVSLIDAVTTNKTDFFREPEHFQYLLERAIPELLKHRHLSRSAPLKIWSAASSTGAEAYTLAMLLAELMRADHALRVSILATDICTEVLQAAMLGIYPESMIEPVPMELRRRYVLKSKRGAAGRVRMAPELRRMIAFGRLNLMEAPYGVDTDMDVIFLRNILIYFDKQTQHNVLTQLCEHLRPGGYLFLGHSETLSGLGMPLQPVATSIFRRM